VCQRENRKGGSKKHAHVIIPEGGHNTVALDMIVDRLERQLKK